MEPVYALVKNSLKPFVARGLRWTVEGVHMIPRHGPGILACNHSAYLDPLAVGYLTDLVGRPCRFLAKRELFDKRVVGWVFRQMRQIPVDRGTGDAVKALDAAVDALERGELMAIFPEATISLDLDPMPGKTGTARLAQLTRVPVTPVGMWGSHRVLFKHRKPNWTWGVPQVACVGPPVRIGPDDDIYEATDRIMEAVAAQVRRARELYPEGPSSRRGKEKKQADGDWWHRPPESAVLRTCARPDGSQGEERGSAQDRESAG
ncbi:MAG TPA: lysophospholipid acyltransferase family protein [Acidimicrobiia bacterium]|nr:lysophospholipid acyltransferase family protein [Acidimicrobiia bacterium]